MNLNSIQKQTIERLSQEKLDGLMLWGADNITYLAQIPFPFVQSLPHRHVVLLASREKAVVFCSVDFADVPAQCGWEGGVVTISESITPEALAEKISSTVKKEFPNVEHWAVDEDHISECLWNALTEKKLSLTGCDKILCELRMVKTDEEICKLTKASGFAERGLVSTLNHTEGTFDAVSYARAETAERMRVHVAEFGGQAVGQVIALQGEDLKLYHGINHDRVTDHGLTRYDLTAAYEGYWSSAGRTIYVGIPDQEAKDAYSDNLKLKNFVVSQLKPGVKCCEIFARTEAKSVEWGIPFMKEAGIGYGVGVTEREAPFLNASDATELKKNMVLAVDLWTFGPAGEWIHSVDTYVITDDGCDRISWYRDYDRLYKMIGITARHG